MGVHVAALNIPFMQSVLGTTAPTLEQWALLVALGATVLVVMELHKFRLWLRRTD
jgi:hypothetical protein